MKKTLCLLLSLLMLLPLAACASENAGKTEDTTAPSVTDPSGDTETTAPEAETINPALVDNLPADLNYENVTFGIYTRDKDFFHGAINVAESNGEQLNDALYERARSVEERLGVVFEETLNTDNTDPAKLAIQAGDTAYKLVNARNVHTVQYASQNLGYRWDQVKNIDLEKDYWYDSINKNLTMANVIFTAAGAYNLSSYDYTHVLMFNKQMVTDLNLENPYDLVKNNQWTFDKFVEFGTAALADVNGDGVYDLNDRYGLVSGAKQIPPCFWIAAEQQGMIKNAEDIPEFTMPADETFNKILTEIYELAWDSEIWYRELSTDDNIPESSKTLFAADQSLMMGSTFYHVELFREMEADFGILPYPKYSAEQENYVSRIEGCELPLIPSSLSQEEADMTGAVLEALSSYSAVHTIPVYYEVYLKTRNARDAESAEMFDIIFANRVFDLSDTIWCENIRDGFILSMFKANNRNLASIMKKSTNAINKAVDNIIKGFQD